MRVKEAGAVLASHRLAALGQRGVDFLAVRRLCALEAFVICEGGPDLELVTSDALILSPERQDGRRRRWTNHSLDELAAFADTLPAGGPTSPPLEMLAYCSTLRWERSASSSDGRLRMAAPAAELKVRLDEKAWVREELQSLGIPVPLFRVVPTGELDFGELTRELGEPLVVQRPTGSSGLGTYLARSPADFGRARLHNPDVGTWLVSAYAGPSTLNYHGLATPNGTMVSRPSVQLAGVPELASSFAAYCGNDFGAISQIPKSVLAEAERNLHRVGSWLGSVGYQGLFGVDLLLEEGTLRVLEVNPRLQGSTWLLSELELEAGEVPLSVRHFLHWLGHTPPKMGTASSGPAGSTVGAQLIIHWTGRADLRIESRVRPGIYELDKHGRLAFRREALGLLECEEDEFILFGLPPQPAAIVEPEAVLARVASRRALGGVEGRSLTEFGGRVAAALSQALIPSLADVP